VINHLTYSEETYMGLRATLLERLRDKEPIIRIHSVVAFTRLCGSEDPEDLSEDEPSLLQVLEETLAYDPSA
jgi:condensin complex subunit 3